MSVSGAFVGQPLSFKLTPQKQVSVDDVRQDLRQARREIELLKTMVSPFLRTRLYAVGLRLKFHPKDPFRAAEMAIEIQIERMHVVEAMTARDVVVQRLNDAHVSIRQKVMVIDRLELEKEEIRKKLFVSKGPCDEEYEEERSKASLEVERLRGIIKVLQEEVKSLKDIRTDLGKPLTDPPPRYEEGKAIKVQFSPTSAAFVPYTTPRCLFS
jgi:hypothetical protein